MFPEMFRVNPLNTCFVAKKSFKCLFCRATADDEENMSLVEANRAARAAAAERMPKQKRVS